MSYDDDGIIIDYDEYDKVCYDEESKHWYACERDGTVIPESECDCEEDAIDFWWDNVFDPDVDGPDDEDEDDQNDQEPDNSENDQESDDDDE